MGLHNGMVICQNMRHSLAPSMRPASYSSGGRLSKNPFRRKMPKPLARLGRINAQKVFIRLTESERSNAATTFGTTQPTTPTVMTSASVALTSKGTYRCRRRASQ